MVLCRAVDTLFLYFGFSGCPFVSTDVGVRCGWDAPCVSSPRVDVILSCSFLLLLSYIVANVELSMLSGTTNSFSDFSAESLISPLMRMPISEEPSIIFSYNLCPPCRIHLRCLFTFRLCRVRFRSCRRRQSRQSCCRSPLACPRRPFRSVVPVSQFLRRYAREGLTSFSRDLCWAGCVSRFPPSSK